MFPLLTQNSELAIKFNQISAWHELPCTHVQMIYWRDITKCCLVRFTCTVTPTYRAWPPSEQHYSLVTLSSQD